MEQVLRMNTCPHCQADLQGEPIPQASIDSGLYGTATHGRREICVEVRGVYDGGLFWMCPDCGGRWHRHDPESHLGLRAQPYIDGKDFY